MSSWIKLSFFHAVFVITLLGSHCQADDEKALRETVDLLRQQVQSLTNKLEQMEKRLDQKEAALAPARPLITPAPNEKFVQHGELENSIHIPGTQTAVALGGIVRFDALYNSRSVGGEGGSNIGDQIMIPGEIPLDGDSEHNENDQYTAHARQSRIWIKSLTPTAWGDLNLLFEMDFFASQANGNERVSNSYTPRMRHAYGKIGHFLAGQTWTTFMSDYALPELIDVLGGPVGRVLIRQPIVRWTQTNTVWNQEFEWQVGIEEPETTLTQVDGTRSTPNDDNMPDLVSRININREWGKLSLATLFRSIRSDTDTEDNAYGGAVNFSGKINAHANDDFRWMISYGNALGRYVSNNFANDGAIDSNGSIELFDVYSGYAAYRHWWAEEWRSTLVHGITYADNVDFVSSTTNKMVQSTLVNLIWSPVRQFDLGLEYSFSTRELESGRDGKLHRVQFSSSFRF